MLDGIVAVVNDEPITQQEVEEMMLPLTAGAFAEESLLPKDLQEARRAALQQLIEERVLVHAARQAQVVIDEAAVDERLREIRDRFKSPEEFEAALVAQGLTRQDLLDRFREQFMVRRLIEQEVRSRVSVSPGEVGAYFTAHEAAFATPEEVRARHILFRISEELPEAQAAARANEVYEWLRNGNTPHFGDAARKHSAAPEAEQGGDLGWVRGGQLMPELDAALFALPIQGLSPPIRTKLGFHLLHVEDRHEAGRQTLEQVRTAVEDRLYAEKFKAAFAAWLDKLKDQAYIHVQGS